MKIIRNWLRRMNCNHHYRRHIVDAGTILYWGCVKCGKFKTRLKKGESFEYREGEPGGLA